MSEADDPNIEYQKLPFRHPLRQRRELLMVSQGHHEFCSALAGMRVLRVAWPYAAFFAGLLMAWEGSVEAHDLHVLLAFVGIWVFADIAVRYADWRAKAVNAELEGLDREIAAEIERLATAPAGGQ